MVLIAPFYYVPTQQGTDGGDTPTTASQMKAAYGSNVQTLRPGDELRFYVDVPIQFWFGQSLEWANDTDGEGVAYSTIGQTRVIKWTATGSYGTMTLSIINDDGTETVKNTNPWEGLTNGLLYYSVS